MLYYIQPTRCPDSAALHIVNRDNWYVLSCTYNRQNDRFFAHPKVYLRGMYVVSTRCYQRKVNQRLMQSTTNIDK